MQDQVKTLQRTVDEKMGSIGAQVTQALDSANKGNTSVAVLQNTINGKLSEIGTSLAAQDISLSADTGTLTIAGRLDASGTSGTRIVLAGGNGVDVDAGAAISAHSIGSAGSQVALLGGTRTLQADGTFAGSGGAVNFNGGSIDVGAGTGGADGTLLIRALRGADGTGVAVGQDGSISLLMGKAPLTGAAMPATRVGVFRGGVAFLEDSNGNTTYDPGADRFIPNFTGTGGFVSGDIPVVGDWIAFSSARKSI